MPTAFRLPPVLAVLAVLAPQCVTYVFRYLPCVVAVVVACVLTRTAYREWRALRGGQ